MELKDIESLFPQTIINTKKPQAKSMINLMGGTLSLVKEWVSLLQNLLSVKDCPSEYLYFIGKNLGLNQANLTDDEYRILISSYFYRSNASLNSLLSYYLLFFEPSKVFLDYLFFVGEYLDGIGVLDNNGVLNPEEGYRPTVFIKRENLETPLSKVFDIVSNRIRPVGYGLTLIDWVFIDLQTSNLKINFTVDNTSVLDASALLDGTGYMDPEDSQKIALKRVDLFYNNQIINTYNLRINKLPYDGKSYYVAQINKQNQQFNKIQWIGENDEVLLALEGEFAQNMVEIFITFPTRI